MADLTLPGSIPGLLRRGSPVIYQQRGVGDDVGGGWSAIDNAARAPVRALVVDPMESRPAKVLLSTCRSSSVRARAVHVALDLTDATGRAHAAWWLASVFWLQGGGGSHVGWSPDYLAGRRWKLYAECDMKTFGAPGQDADVTVPSLADVDPLGPGWDEGAEALRIVCLHVAGMGGEQ